MKEYKKKIGELNLTTHRVPVKDALRLKFRLIKMFGPMVVSAFQEDISGLTKVLADTEAEEAVDMVEELCEHCNISGEGKLNFLMHLNNPESVNMMDVYKIAAWVLEVNFQDFFGESGLHGLADKLEKMGVTSASSNE